MTTMTSSRRRVLLVAGAGLALAPAAGLMTGCAQGGVGGALSGRTAGESGDAFQVLAADHRRVDALFQQALKTTNAQRTAGRLAQMPEGGDAWLSRMRELQQEVLKHVQTRSGTSSLGCGRL